jgi:sec-independent protein translocase protein TatB
MSSGIAFSEILIIFVIGLIILGPERLPRVASQFGTWIGKARRMTRVMKRQLEEELDVEKHLGIHPSLLQTPRDDDNYSPLHGEDVEASSMGAAVTKSADDNVVDADTEKPREQKDG